MTEVFDGYTSTATMDDGAGVSFEQLLETMARIRKPDLYYATFKFIPLDKVFFMEATQWEPKYFACHPDDYDRLEGQLKVEFTLIPLVDYQPSEADSQARIGRLTKRITDDLFGYRRNDNDDDSN